MTSRSILIINSHFYPGFRAGGPPKCIFNLVNSSLSSKYSFSIFTRDRDVGESIPYDTVLPSQWSIANSYRIYYAPPHEFSLIGFILLFLRRKYSILYLNSFFGFQHSILPLLLFLLFTRSGICLIAPRGEFDAGALSIKSFKKRFYLFVFSLLSKHISRIRYHATSPIEYGQIQLYSLCFSF